MKKLIYFIVNTVVVTLVSIILLIFILPNLKFINLGNILNNETFNVSDVIGMLSLNLGILQGLMAIVAIGLGVIGYINFTHINNKLKNITKKSKKVDEALKDVKSIVEQHENIIRDFKSMSDNERQEVKNIENIVSNNNITKLDNIGGGKNEL